LRSEDVLGEFGLQDLEPPAGAADPVRQGRTAQFDALPGKDLALSIKGEVVAVFRDEDIGEQARGRKALGDRPFRSGRLMDRPAGPAAIAGPADTDDPQPGWHMIEHLARRLAD
jgi:hypothetical protein